MPFTLPLRNDGHVGVLENLLGLRFNLEIRTMYFKQQIYFADNGAF